MHYSYEVRIPKERVAVLIGKSGETKRALERATHSRIRVDSEDGNIYITGEDSLKLFTLRDVITAIGRGFNPETAKLVLNPGFSLEVVNIKDFVKPSKNHLLRVRARVIGRSGKTRETLERLSGTHISIYGKTIAIIGTSERASIARQAVEYLVKGSPHGHVYKWLERTIARQRAMELL